MSKYKKNSQNFSYLLAAEDEIGVRPPEQGNWLYFLLLL